MGCGESKSPKVRPVAGSYPLLDTPEEQSAQFLRLCSPPSPPRRHGHSDTARTATYPNPLAVELRRVYAETRQRVFEQQREDGEAVSEKQAKEREARLMRVHGRRVVPTGIATTAAADQSQKLDDTIGAAAVQGEERASTPLEGPSVLPPALLRPVQKDFVLYVNDSVAQAQHRHFSAYDAVAAVELFIGYVKHDLRVQQEQAYKENISRRDSSRGLLNSSTTGGAVGGKVVVPATSSTAAAAAPVPSVPWTCWMQCTLSADTPAAEALLVTARRRWTREREASHLRRTTSQQGRDAGGRKKGCDGGTAADSTASRHAAEGGGRGLLFIDAVFESVVPGSFDRRTPWQLEIIVYFTA
jgi:hypothetical protein